MIEGVEITRGAHSWLEREVLRLLDAAGVSRPTPQQVLGRRGDRLIRVVERPDYVLVLGGIVEALSLCPHRSA